MDKRVQVYCRDFGRMTIADEIFRQTLIRARAFATHGWSVTHSYGRQSEQKDESECRTPSVRVNLR